MNIRIPTLLLGAAVLLACGQDAAQEIPRETASADPAGLFVDQPAADAQLLFVGLNDDDRPADLPDALFVPLSTFMVERDGVPNMFPPTDSMARMLEAAGVRDGRVVIVGEPIPAGRAFAGFDYLGLGHSTVLLDGGQPAILTGHPDTPGPARAGADRGLNTDVRDDVIVDADWVHERLDDPRFVILDARPPAEFSGETPGDGIDRPGHIPGASNVFWATLVNATDDTRLKDQTELRRIFEEAGVGPEQTIVAYCRTGGQAGFLYTVARHLGYDVRLYDGSFIDWSRTEYPVER